MSDGWDITEELRYIRLRVDALYRKMDEMKEGFYSNEMKITEEISALKVKSGVWGAIGGVIPVVAVLLVWLAKVVIVHLTSGG